MRRKPYYPKSGPFNYGLPGKYPQAKLRPFQPRGGPYALGTEKGKIRDPVKYLTQKHGMPKKYAQQFLAQPAVIKQYWKEDNSGPYVNSEFLDSIGYGWKHEREELMSTIKSTEKVREASYKLMKEEEGKIPTQKEMAERIEKMPYKYQKKLGKIQRVMKVIKK